MARQIWQKDREKRNEEEAHEVVRLRAPVVYTAIRQEGEDELSRPALSLWWSGLAAGIAIFLSVIAMSALHAALGNEPGTAGLLLHLGYTFGFLVVILGRLQLFTENTITAVIPLLAQCTGCNAMAMTRLWGIVFMANMVGVFLAALAAMQGGIMPPELTHAMIELSAHYTDRSAMAFFLEGVPAGFIVAALVWMLPSSKGQEFWVIVSMTFLLSLGGFTHVIAGAGEIFVTLLQGTISVYDAVTSAILPTLAGNVIGGTVLFALLAHGQVSEEIG